MSPTPSTPQRPSSPARPTRPAPTPGAAAGRRAVPAAPAAALGTSPSSTWRLVGTAAGMLLLLVGVVLVIGWMTELGVEAAAPVLDENAPVREAWQLLVGLGGAVMGVVLIVLCRPRQPRVRVVESDIEREAEPQHPAGLGKGSDEGPHLAP